MSNNNKKVPELDTITPDASDLVYVVDVSDTTDHPSGSSKKALVGSISSEEVNDLTAAVTWADIPIANVPTGTTGSTVALGNHTHTGVYEPADAAIVKSDENETISANWSYTGSVTMSYGPTIRRPSDATSGIRFEDINTRRWTLGYLNAAGNDSFFLSRTNSSGYFEDYPIYVDGTAGATGGRVTFANPLMLTETANAFADVAGDGQLWVKSDTPNTLWFTDDAGTDFQLGVGASASHVHEGTEIDATGVTDGYVLTADGAGNSAWEAAATIADGTTTNEGLKWSGSAWVGTGSQVIFSGGTGAGLITLDSLSYSDPRRPQIWAPALNTTSVLWHSETDVDESGFYMRTEGGAGDTIQNQAWGMYCGANSTAYDRLRLRDVTIGDGICEYRSPSTGTWSEVATVAGVAASYEPADAAIVKSDEAETITANWTFSGDVSGSGTLDIAPNARSVTATGNTATTDYSKVINLTGGTGQTFTLDADPPANAIIFIDNSSGNSWTIAASTSLIWAKDATTGNRTLADDGVAIAKHRGSGTWVISGSALLT